MTQREKVDDANDDTIQSCTPPTIRTWIGIVLVVVSGVMWFSLFAIPFLPLSTFEKTAIGGTIFVGVQISWWSGAALVGPRAMRILSNWFRRRRIRSADV